MSRRLLVIVIVLLIAFALRLHGLADQSLWFDETVTGVSIRDAHLNPLLVEARSFLYFAMIAPSYIAIPTDFGLRWPSIVAGMFSIAVIYRIGKLISGEQAGLIAAGLLTISPYFIHYSREARHYAVVGLLTLITLWLVLRLRHESRWDGLLFITVAMVLAGVHAMTVFWLAPLFAVMTLRRWLTGEGASWRVLMGAVVAITLILLVIRSVGIAGRGYLEGLVWIEALSLTQLPKKFLTQGLGIEWLTPLGKRLIISAVVGALILSGASMRRIIPLRLDWSVVLLITLSFAPIVLVIVVSLAVLPLWVLRYLTPALMTFVLLIAILVARLRPSRLAAAALCALITSGMLSYTVHPQQQPENWRSLKTYLEDNLRIDDLVFACGSQAAVPLAYYMPRLPIYYLTNQAGLSDTYSSEALLTQTRDAPNSIPPNVRRVWIVTRSGRLCTLAEYGIDAVGIEAEPAELIHFTGVTLMRYEREESP